MRHTTVSELHPTVRRAIMLAAVSAIVVFSIGFAPVLTLLYVLAASCIGLGIMWATGVKTASHLASGPILLALVAPAALSLLVRGTALAWAAIPVLAVVAACAAWIIAVNYAVSVPAAAETSGEAVNEPSSLTMIPADLVHPTSQEKPTVADEDSSATAA